MKRSTSARGYGTEHQAVRSRLAPSVAAGRAVCSVCLMPIAPGARWDLDHTPDRRGYRGPAHERCNRSDGARRGNAMRAAARRAVTKLRW